MGKSRSVRFGVLLAALLSPTLLAQTGPPVDCSAVASPRVVHADGIAEPAGDILIICTAPPASEGDSVQRVDVSVSLNASVTNAVQVISGQTVSDAVLVVNGNDCAVPAAAGSTFGSCGAPFPDVQDPQRGRHTSINTLTWTGVTLPFRADSGEEASVVRPRSATLRIRGVRGNASQLRLAGESSSGGPPLEASITMRSDGAVVLRNSVVSLARPLGGLGLDIHGEDAVSACRGDEGGRVTIRLREGFVRAFRPAAAGGGAPATRVILDFADIPDGVSIGVPPYLACRQPEFDGPGTADFLSIGLVQSPGPDGSGGSPATGAGPPAPVAVDSGRGRAVYEVLTHGPLQVEDCHIPVRFEEESGRVSNARATVAASFAPRSDVLEASSRAPVPRFTAPASSAAASVDLAACGTTLLFPFVSNQAGFDTGLVITHGSLQSLTGALERQTGSCDLHYYGASSTGETVLLTQHSTPLNPSEQLVFTLSGGNPVQNILGTEQFQGYVVAVCGYPGARGYVFISDGFGGLADLAMGYIAPIVPVDARGRRRVLREAGR